MTFFFNKRAADDFDMRMEANRCVKKKTELTKENILKIFPEAVFNGNGDIIINRGNLQFCIRGSSYITKLYMFESEDILNNWKSIVHRDAMEAVKRISHKIMEIEDDNPFV